MTLAELAWVPRPPQWLVDWGAIHAACPWLEDLAGVPQDPLYHAEGDVLVHTRLVAEAMVQLSPWRNLDPAGRAALFLAALLHDVGKPAVTRAEPGERITAPNHARAGAIQTRALLWAKEGVGAPLPLAEREAVVSLVRLHGLPLWFLERPDIARAVLPASLRARLDQVALLAEADVRGRACSDQDEMLARADLFRAWCGERGCLDGPYPFASDHSRVRYCRGLQEDPDYCAYDDTWGEVILLAGLPGAGKDTWLASHDPGLPVISLDAIRQARGVNPCKEQGTVVAAAKAEARALLRRRQPFVWNATNVTRRIRDPLVDTFLSYGARVRIVYVDAPLEVILRRNRQRPAPVPEAVIQRLAAQTEPPDLGEAHVVTWVETV